ncbi:MULTISPECIES: hypothetical protein [unclassified Myxococcus]|jgi:hypothetical protein|uniref:hypothetical protein n=1 Tax=Myxococcus TaxID=32 RepID=UPI0011440425|nr:MULTISPECIES: hypothetical protein [unclassified Myxococcus]MBZ4402291.1 hypothetical protein [Myxococcus sp. AS-1-15]BDT34830.1 hypothetical protein MFMH1_44990 [Myxococcus sp. MH1]
MFKTHIIRSTMLAAATLLSTSCGVAAPEESLESDATSTRGDALGGAEFWHDFRAYSGASPECNGFNVSEGRGLGQWTSQIRLDTDSRPQGCWQKFGIQDPYGELSGLMLTVSFYGQGSPTASGQCDNPGTYVVPIGPTLDWTGPWGIDTTDAYGGCVQTFSISGRDDIALDVRFDADRHNGQCQNAGLHTVTSINPVSLTLDMDNRYGGCYQTFRLRKMTCGDNVCESGELCPADCMVCGDGICNGSETRATCPEDCFPQGPGNCAIYCPPEIP